MSEQAKTPADIMRHLLEEPDSCPDSEEVAVLAEAYPYLALPAAMRLRLAPPSEVSSGERRNLMSRVAFGMPGQNTLFRLADPDGDLLAGFMPPVSAPAPTATTTDSAIDTFLATYGRMSAHEEALLEKMIFNPVPDDYAALLAREDAQANTPPEASADVQDRLLDAFLASQEPSSAVRQESSEADAVAQTDPKAAPKPAESAHTVQRAPKAAPAPPVTPSPSSSLSESLAQVYIKRGRYDKAYDIIHALSLNNPKKSVYFADQLRFLQKLMLNQQCASEAPDGQNQP